MVVAEACVCVCVRVWVVCLRSELLSSSLPWLKGSQCVRSKCCVVDTLLVCGSSRLFVSTRVYFTRVWKKQKNGCFCFPELGGKHSECCVCVLLSSH